MNDEIQKVLSGGSEGCIVCGDCLDVMAEIPDGCVQCVVTSPPYWGLRDYGTASWQGGDENCEHLQPHGKPRNERPNTTNCGIGKGGDYFDAQELKQYTKECKKCGAKRVDQQLGLEETPEEYVGKMVAVFAEVKRVLRDDGTLFLNFGDSYNGSAMNKTGSHGYNDGRSNRAERFATGGVESLKPKDLCGIPWRVAFALQGFAVVPFRSFSVWADELKIARELQDWEAVEIVEAKLRAMDLLSELQTQGWWLRQDIIWHKPNPMPESVTDRCTKAHEYIFLMTKSQKYFYDAEAIKEDSVPSGWDRQRRQGIDTWKYNDTQERIAATGGNNAGTFGDMSSRNKRSVWTVPTAPYKEAHFATFPPKLIEPCIEAGTSERGCCPQCGAPWVRMVEKTKSFESGSGKSGNVIGGKHGEKCQGGGDTGDIRKGPVVTTKTTGWEPGCECGAELEPVGCVVFDPFMGAGTTAKVAAGLGRGYIGIELSTEYAEMARTRIHGPLFTTGKLT